MIKIRGLRPFDLKICAGFSSCLTICCSCTGAWLGNGSWFSGDSCMEGDVAEKEWSLKYSTFNLIPFSVGLDALLKSIPRDVFKDNFESNVGFGGDSKSLLAATCSTFILGDVTLTWRIVFASSKIWGWL